MKYIFPVITIMTCIVLSQSCSKGGDSTPPPPTPVVKPDTLSTGWVKQAPPEAGYCNDIFFNSTTTGYLMNSVFLYRSTNGGNSWTKIGGTPSVSWVNIFATNDDKAFFTNNNPDIFRTVNGANPTLTNLNARPDDVFFIDNSNGFLISTSGLLNTIDGGNNWLKPTTTGLPTPSSDYVSLYFINSSTGWVLDRGAVYRSLGSFLNWQLASVTGSTTGGNFSSIYATSASNIYVANWTGEIFKSTNGGANFSKIAGLNYNGFTDIHFINDLLGYASVGRFIFKTIDGGVNWTRIVALGQNGLIEIHFTDANHGWACGDNTVLIFTQ